MMSKPVKTMVVIPDKADVQASLEILKAGHDRYFLSSEMSDDELLSMSPKDWYRVLDQNVYGQDEAKRKASLIMWKHLHGIRSTSLFIGLSGCGKTEIWRVIKNIYTPIIIADAGTITNDGWSGRQKYYSALKEISFSRIPAKWWIVVYDEFDKCVQPRYSASRENVSYSIQAEMLKVIEGTEINVAKADYDPEIIDTSKISFVFLGAFISLLKEEDTSYGFNPCRQQAKDRTITIEDVITFGLRPELAGRIESICQMNELSEEDLYAICLNPYYGPAAKLSRLYSRIITMTKATARRISHEAARSGLGARYLFSLASNMTDDIIFEDPDIKKIIL